MPVATTSHASRCSFADGSIGTVHYFANGHQAFPKERLEVFAGGRVLQLDNFRELRGYGWPGFTHDESLAPGQGPEGLRQGASSRPSAQAGPRRFRSTSCGGRAGDDSGRQLRAGMSLGRYYHTLRRPSPCTVLRPRRAQPAPPAARRPPRTAAAPGRPAIPAATRAPEEPGRANDASSSSTSPATSTAPPAGTTRPPISSGSTTCTTSTT